MGAGVGVGGWVEGWLPPGHSWRDRLNKQRAGQASLTFATDTLGSGKAALKGTSPVIGSSFSQPPQPLSTTTRVTSRSTKTLTLKGTSPVTGSGFIFCICVFT